MVTSKQSKQLHNFYSVGLEIVHIHAWAIPGIVAGHAAGMQVTGINYQVPMKMSSHALF